MLAKRLFPLVCEVSPPPSRDLRVLPAEPWRQTHCERHGGCSQPALSRRNTHNLAGWPWENKAKLAQLQSGLLLLYFVPCTITAVFTASLPQPGLNPLRVPAKLPSHFHATAEASVPVSPVTRFLTLPCALGTAAERARGAEGRLQRAAGSRSGCSKLCPPRARLCPRAQGLAGKAEGQGPEAPAASLLPFARVQPAGLSAVTVTG